MSAARASVGPRLRRVALRQSYAFALLLLVVAIAINYYLQPNFFQPGILSGNLLLFVPLMLVAVGQTAVVIGGGIDLSLGTIVSMTNVIFVSLMGQEPSPRDSWPGFWPERSTASAWLCCASSRS